MTTLRWDLQEKATRRTLLEATCALLSSAQCVAVEEARDAAGMVQTHCHDLIEVDDAIDALDVSENVRDDLRGIYRILAEAEAAAHGCSVDETHFHEVGNASGILNTLHICLAIEEVAPDEIVASAVQVGVGTVQCAHGELPIPAPATAAILARGIPVCEHTLPGERCTPTSAAIILHFVDRFE